MANKIFIVNDIDEESGVTHGYVVSNSMVLTNYKTMFGEKKTKGLMIYISQHPNDFHFVERFCQYVGLIQYEVKHGLSMKLSDFKSNMDNVLDEYLKLNEKLWPSGINDKYAKIVQEIIADKNGELAELIVFTCNS